MSSFFVSQDSHCSEDCPSLHLSGCPRSGCLQECGGGKDDERRLCIPRNAPYCVNTCNKPGMFTHHSCPVDQTLLQAFVQIVSGHSINTVFYLPRPSCQCSQLLDEAVREDYFDDLKEEYEEIRREHYDSLTVRMATLPASECTVLLKNKELNCVFYILYLFVPFRIVGICRFPRPERRPCM